MGKGTPAITVQGHRGARGLKPENTLPAFEAALDVGADTVETDVHLTRDGVPVLIHDYFIGPKIYRFLSENSPSVPAPAENLLVRSLDLHHLRAYRGDLNPDPERFPEQNAAVTPLARSFAEQRGIDPYAIPTVGDLIAFVEAYAGEPGRAARKTERQRGHAQLLCIDLELKRVPFYPERIGDGAAPNLPGLLETNVLDVLRRHDFMQRTIVRSFDHRCLQALRALEPALTTAVLIAGTAPANPAQLAAAVGARLYCPDYQYLDELQVRQLHDAGLRVMPWTVNDPADWARLVHWGVDGITSDYPDRLLEWLGRRKC